MEQAKQYEYVDLGLPSGLKWAKCNVGAEKETQWGDYFMWGSTEPNAASQCTWSNAPFNNGSSHYDKTYFNSVKDTVCPNRILSKEYDAATQIMGGDWRMPTKADFQELLDYTNHEWVENFNSSSVNGRKFTSKTDGSKYIFIPAAGCCYSGSIYCGGSFSLVWSSSLRISSPYYALELSFNSDSYDVYDYYRCYGFSVRGVMN